jgi:hypothetical protein
MPIPNNAAPASAGNDNGKTLGGQHINNDNSGSGINDPTQIIESQSTSVSLKTKTMAVDKAANNCTSPTFDNNTSNNDTIPHHNTGNPSNSSVNHSTTSPYHVPITNNNAASTNNAATNHPQTRDTIAPSNNSGEPHPLSFYYIQRYITLPTFSLKQQP